jgi:hypothetical protein
MPSCGEKIVRREPRRRFDVSTLKPGTPEMADAPALPVPTRTATPPVMRAATLAYERARRVRSVGIAALGGGAVALAAAAARGVVGFLIAWRLRRR